MSAVGKTPEGNVEAETDRRFKNKVLDWQRGFRRRYGGPYRSVLSAACRVIFARGQIDTSRVVHLHAVGFEALGRQEHAPSGWWFMRRALKGCEITPADVFVDFGSGMGRAAYVAARYYPFGRVIGVEIVGEFNAIAAENVRRMKHKLRCKHVEFVTCDATTYDVPDDMTYAYFFNPFTDDIFEKVLANIVASLDRHPRTVTICYANPTMENVVLNSGRFAKVRETTGIRRDIPLYRLAVYRSI
jgi:SAM-dependent methyltransferase